MKVAIWGSGPLAVEATLFFLELGASCVLFSRELNGGGLAKLLKIFPDFEFSNTLTCTSQWGRKMSNWNHPPQERIFLKDYFLNYFFPLVQQLKNHDKNQLKMIRAEVLRVHKCFLGVDDFLENKSRRMKDLFRVVYTVSNKEKMEKQKNEFSEFFNKLSENCVLDLFEDSEGYEDVDVVIDARGVLAQPFFMGPGANLALNEAKFKDKIYYGTKKADLNLDFALKSQEILIVGSGATSALWLVKIFSHIKNQNFAQIRIITKEKNPFEKFFKESQNSFLSKELNLCFREAEKIWDQRKKYYEKALFDSRNQGAEEPNPPVPLIQILSESVICSVDQLSDEHKFFITCEESPYKNRENNKLQTFSCDHIIVCTGYRLPSLEKNWGILINQHVNKKNYILEDSDPGYFILGPIKENLSPRYSLEDGIKQIEEIKEQLMLFFSPR